MNYSNTNLNESKRWFIKLTALLTVTLISNIASKKANASMFIDNDIVIVNGWVMLKSDFH